MEDTCTLMSPSTSPISSTAPSYRGRRRKKPATARPPNPDDLWLADLRKQCALAMVAWLKVSVNIARPIKSLNLDEMQGLAEAATARWIVLVSQRQRDAPESDEAIELSVLLI